MSLYTCIDKLDKEIQKIELLEKSFNWLFTENYLKRLKEEKELAQQLRANFIIITEKDRYSTRDSVFDYEFSLIKAYRTKYNDLPSYLKFIQDDLTQIFYMLSSQRHISIYERPQDIKKYLNKYKDYHIASVQQQLDYRSGLDEGNCFGYVYAMVDPGLTVYRETKRHYIALNQQIYDYQNNQFGVENKITRQRLTRRIFCPDLQQQAEQLWEKAAQNPGRDLLVALQARRIGHATYLSVQEDHSIRYMDPNIGAYLFKEKKEFINFYKDTYKNFFHFKFYQLSKLHYDPEGILTEEKTLSGLMRTLLSGEKRAYTVGSVILSFGTSLGMYLALQKAPSLLLVTAPVIVQNMSSCISTIVILSSLGGIWSGYKGLLGGSHFIQELWYDTISSKLNLGFFNQKSEQINENQPASIPNLGLN